MLIDCRKGGPTQNVDFQERLNDAEEVVNRIADADISITVADPSLDDMPLVGISAGFTTLTGYSAQEILGRNCRFLIDGVPKEHRMKDQREKARKFCQACSKAAVMKDSSELDPEDYCCWQINCRKDGSLFCNMFLLHFVRIDGKACVVGLQHKVVGMLPGMDPTLVGKINGMAKAPIDVTDGFSRSNRLNICLKASLKEVLARLCMSEVDEDNEQTPKHHDEDSSLAHPPMEQPPPSTFNLQESSLAT